VIQESHGQGPPSKRSPESFEKAAPLARNSALIAVAAGAQSIKQALYFPTSHTQCQILFRYRRSWIFDSPVPWDQPIGPGLFSDRPDCHAGRRATDFLFFDLLIF
jgi:hypothetical protein